MTSSGVSVNCCGEGMLWIVGAAGLFRDSVVLNGVLDCVVYDVELCYESKICSMYTCHVGCIRDDFGVRLLGCL